MINPFRVLASLAVWAVLATLVAACGGAPGGPEDSSTGPQPVDTTPPAVVSKIPTTDQELVDRASAIVVTFSEALNPATVTSTNVLLRRAGAGNVPRVVTWDPLSNTVYIKKPATVVTPFLERDTQYTVTLTRGLRDKAGNELPEQVEWSFTTGTTIDHEPPEWRCSAVVTAEPFRFDAVKVSWDGRDTTLCEPGSTEAETPATDNVTPAENLVYIVSYKLVSEATFSTMTSGSGATWLEVTGLSPGQAYKFKVQVRDLADYLSDFRSLGSVDEGKAIYDGKGTCAVCHGATGKGDGPAGAVLDPPPTDFTDPIFHASRTDAQLFAAIKDGIPRTGMISFNPALINDPETWQVIAYIRSLVDGSTVGSVTMPPAGRLYAANFLANAVSSIPDIGTVNGDRVGTQVFYANETGLSTPLGVAVSAGSVTLQDATSCAPSAAPCQAPSMLYVSNWSANSITAYENPETLGRYDKLSPDELQRINAKPAWILRGVETSLAQPAALWVDMETDANGVVQEILYVANMRGMSRTFLGEQPVGNILAFDVTRKDGNRTGAPQEPTGNSPPIGKIKSEWFRTPMAFAVDKNGHRLYVANRDKDYDRNTGAGDQQGNVILAFQIPDGGLDSLMNDPVPVPYAFIQGSLLGPTGIALDKDNDRLYVANREQNNLVVIENASSADPLKHTTRVIEGPGAKLVIDHPTSSAYKAYPNAVFFDPATDRLFATTRNAQSVLIFDVSDTVMGTTGSTQPIDLAPVRVIRGSRTGLGQPTGSAQSAGPFGITVVNGEAYVASFGLHAIPIFDVPPAKDIPNAVPTTPANTPPDRLLMDPMQGLTGAALDQPNDRLYVAVFHTNLILVYDDASTLTAGPPRPLPDRIIGGPKTKLDHPVHLAFSPATADHTAVLFVANQSGHSVLVFGGEPLPVLPGETALDVGDLNGNVEPSRVIGPPPEVTDPFWLDNPLSPGCSAASPPVDVNCTELAFPTGIALDELNHVLYVSNRDATKFEDFKGRKILAFKDVFDMNVRDNVPPTWKIEGGEPPLPGYYPVVTDKTTLERPAALYYDPDQDRLYVANRGPKSILVFTDISKTVKAPPLPLNYNVAPDWTIKNANLFAPTGFTGYIPPGQSSLRELYVADAAISAILAFRVDALDPGVPLPTLTPRIIKGTSLGLSQPFGLALDPEK